MDNAVLHKLQHPQESYTTVADRFDVASSTLHDRVTGKHAPPGHRQPRNLSIHHERVLLDKINAYATRGTLLTPGHIGTLAETLSERHLGRNWTSTFLKRHKDEVSSKFYKVQEVARLKADTPTNRQAFYSLVIEFELNWVMADQATGQGHARYRPVYRG